MLPADFEVDAPRLQTPAVFEQQWRDLAFLHWSVDPADVAHLMPSGVRPDVLDGRTYVGLIPFHMRRAGPGRGLPTPWLGDFLETNVRLYSVDDQGRHGVVFRSLEATRLMTVLAARYGYRIPYTWSHMRVARRGTEFRYLSRRRWPNAGLRSAMTIEVGPVVEDQTELDVFLTARWGLHGTLLGRTVWHPNWHLPWQLHEARLVELQDDLVAAAGIEVKGMPDVDVRWSGGVQTVFGPPQPI